MLGDRGLKAGTVVKIVVKPATREVPEITILLLSRPEDEAAAAAYAVKSGKSNSSD